MINFIENVLYLFESCFSRKAAFRWFVTITVGLMLCSDKLGVTSVIRDLALCPGCYDSMIHFFVLLEKLRSLNNSGDVRMEIITKAKKSCTAFEKPGSQKSGRGHPPKKGTAVHLKELFITLAGEFQETEIELYGKKESIRYYCIGKEGYRKPLS